MENNVERSISCKFIIFIFTKTCEWQTNPMVAVGVGSGGVGVVDAAATEVEDCSEVDEEVEVAAVCLCLSPDDVDSSTVLVTFVKHSFVKKLLVKASQSFWWDHANHSFN